MNQGFTFVLGDTPVFFLWNGLHTVNVRLDPMGKDLDCFTVGDQTVEAATPEEVEEAIVSRLMDPEFIRIFAS